MSKEDQIKWDAKYRAGEYATRSHPSAFVAEHISNATTGERALDIACGRGRNCRYLASLGFQVDGVDISPVGLQMAQAQGGEEIHYEQRDLLLDGLGVREPYTVIIMIRFVALELLADMARYLVPGGRILVENHMQVPANCDVQVGGPRSARFRVAPGQLQAAVPEDMQITHSFEGIVQDPDGLAMSVAQIVALRD